MIAINLELTREELILLEFSLSQSQTTLGDAAYKLGKATDHSMSFSSYSGTLSELWTKVLDAKNKMRKNMEMTNI